MRTYAPGPWHAIHDAVFKGKRCLAMCDTEVFSSPISSANARLIAAAPEMFELLKEFEAFTQGQFAYPLGSVQRLREIIAKAEGSDAPR